MQFVIKRVLLVRLEDFPVPFHRGRKQPCFLEPVQLDADRIGRFIKLAFQVPQVGAGIAIEKEPKQELDAGFVGD